MEECQAYKKCDSLQGIQVGKANLQVIFWRGETPLQVVPLLALAAPPHKRNNAIRWGSTAGIRSLFIVLTVLRLCIIFISWMRNVKLLPKQKVVALHPTNGLLNFMISSATLGFLIGLSLSDR